MVVLLILTCITIKISIENWKNFRNQTCLIVRPIVELNGKTIVRDSINKTIILNSFYFCSNLDEKRKMTLLILEMEKNNRLPGNSLHPSF